MRLTALSPATALVAIALVAATSDAPRTPHVGRAPATLLLRVVDSATRLPLPNAEITAQERRGLTDVRGEVRLLYPESGELHVRIRQLGFRYADRTFRRDSASRAEEDTAVVALRRVEWALPQVVVRAPQRCATSSDPARVALSEASMELLRFGAEQYGNFRRTYPFDITIERHSSGRRAQTDTVPSSEWGDRYTPGQVVQRRGPSDFFVPLLFVSALADSAFWDRHCFAARGVETRDGRRLIRLDFSPALGIREPEWEGSAWLDSARSVLARVDFRLTNLRSYFSLEAFEGYTIFSTPTPYIAMPDSTVAHWTTAIQQSYGYVRRSNGMEVQRIKEVTYRKGRPPETR